MDRYLCLLIYLSNISVMTTVTLSIISLDASGIRKLITIQLHDL
jgi:hypothetical protein